jgi:formamidopyrimidine-DNA glycosylase
MPELPEVETYVRELAPVLAGRQVTAAEVRWPRTIAAPSPDEFTAGIVGQRFARFDRRGKYMLLGLASGATLIVHLRMTGRLQVGEPAFLPDKHTHVLLDLDDGRRLYYQDSRKFGRLWLVPDPAPVLRRLGPEPFGQELTLEHLAGRLAGRTATIKALLLDQSILAGVGNIYADEALFHARIHPARPAGSLSSGEITALIGAVAQVLAEGVAHGGSSLGDSGLTNYVRPGGEQGGYQGDHKVFHRTGKPCYLCGTPVERIVLAQRSTHFCPNCQR